jgi:hypothetical protein
MYDGHLIGDYDTPIYPEASYMPNRNTNIRLSLPKFDTP